MNIQLELLLEDRPGMLLASLEPISKNGGNIISILHDRELRKGNMISTTIMVEIPSNEKVRQIIQELKERNIHVHQVSDGTKSIYERSTFLVLLLGHVMETDARDTLDRIMDKGANVLGFGVKISGKNLPSAAGLLIEAEKEKVGKIIKEIEAIAKQKKLTVIRE